MVDVVIPYCNGTVPILDTCLTSFFRHTDKEKCRVLVVHSEGELFDAAEICARFPVYIQNCTLPHGFPTSSQQHSKMLDVALEGSHNDYFLSLDSDCFPVADGWLDDLVKMMEDGATVAGILWPWNPPADDLGRATIEWRIRSQQCWMNTHVACQMVRPDWIREQNIKFYDGDDTGLVIPNRARRLGLKVSGFMPTRCALPHDCPAWFDPEFNRYICVVFGDKVYHHGGSTREISNSEVDFQKIYESIRSRVTEESGAEFILNDAESHQYKFDREEEVSEQKMIVLYNQMKRYLQSGISIFKPKTVDNPE